MPPVCLLNKSANKKSEKPLISNLLTEAASYRLSTPALHQTDLRQLNQRSLSDKN